MTAPEPPYRASASTAGPSDAARWESECGWSERWTEGRFVAQVDMSLVVILSAAGAAVVVGMLCAIASPFGADRGDLAVGFGAVVAAAVFLGVLVLTWGRGRVRIEVTPETSTVTWREATSSPTLAIRDVVAFHGEPLPNGEISEAWGVRWACSGGTVIVPVWTRSEHEAKMRAERLRAVIARFQSGAAPHPDA
jgi:hypothetical protein